MERFPDNARDPATSKYLTRRLAAIEDRLVDTFRYVDLDSHNRATFSYEFASIVRDAGSCFSSTMDAVLKAAGRSGKTTFAMYREFLKAHDHVIERRSVDIRPAFPRSLVRPFSAFSDADGIPDWWTAYNDLKHSEYDNPGAGNLESSVTSVAALKLIERSMGSPRPTQLFVNVGMAYPEDSVDSSSVRLMFAGAK